MAKPLSIHPEAAGDMAEAVRHGIAKAKGIDLEILRKELEEVDAARPGTARDLFIIGLERQHGMTLEQLRRLAGG